MVNMKMKIIIRITFKNEFTNLIENIKALLDNKYDKFYIRYGP